MLYFYILKFLTNCPMQDNIINEFISHVCTLIPDRKSGKRGTKPIPKELLIRGYWTLIRTNCGWRNIKHSSTCRSYIKELQRRGEFKKLFNLLTEDTTKFRVKKSIVDSSDIVSYKTNNLVKYSGKYHNYCVKFTIVVDENLIPIEGRLDKGADSDINIYKKLLSSRDKLPYTEYLDKGYESYDIRRNLKNEGCQIKMEMKNYKTNRKRGPKFSFSLEDKLIRSSIEKVMSWIKGFMSLRLNRFRKKSLISGMFYFALSYVAFMRLKKL
jgi:hypothetical protein